MDSGIRLNPDAEATLLKFKEVKKSIYKWCMLKIVPKDGAVGTKAKQAEEEVAIEDCPEAAPGCTLTKGESWDELCGKLQDEQPLIVVFYLEYTLSGQGQQQKLSAINWCPDTAPMKLKMRYSSTFKTVCDKVPNVNHKMEIHDRGELDFDEIVATLKK